MNNLKLEDLNKIQFELICNGCGGKDCKINPPEWIFASSCDQHDLDYWIGCTELDRSNADWQFYTSMLQAAKEKSSWWNYLWYKSAAWVYYKAVRMFASKYFYFSDKKRTIEDLPLKE